MKHITLSWAETVCMEGTVELSDAYYDHLVKLYPNEQDLANHISAICKRQDSCSIGHSFDNNNSALILNVIDAL